MTLWKKQTAETVKNQWFSGVNRKGERKRQSTEDFNGSEIILYDTIMVDMCHYTFVQAYRMYYTKSEP